MERGHFTPEQDKPPYNGEDYLRSVGLESLIGTTVQFGGHSGLAQNFLDYGPCRDEAEQKLSIFMDMPREHPDYEDTKTGLQFVVSYYLNLHQ